MGILNYTTKIEASVTLSEIQQNLVTHGARKISVDYDDKGMPANLTFTCEWKGQSAFFSLPCRFEQVHKVLLKQTNDSRYNSKDQALRVSWRILKTWIEAQMAILETEMVELPEIFLPYGVTKSGERLYDVIKNDNQLLLIG
jgi:hypothetical protein